MIRPAAPRVAPEPAHPDSWNMATSEALAKAAVAGEVLADLADRDERIAVLTADLKYSNRTIDFERRHPDRFLNVGIAEQNMVSMAAGMATMGYVPYVATFASFVGLLCLEQIRTDLAYPGLPVRVLAHHAGISLGFYGTSHHATEDLSAMRAVAGVQCVCPCDATATRALLEQTVDVPGPVYVRLGRGREPDVYSDGRRPQVGRLERLREGSDLTIVANGVCVAAALEAAAALAADGIEAAVADAHTLRPFDVDGLAELVGGGSPHLLVAEEHNVMGGLASACADALVDRGVGPVRLHRAGLPPDEYALIGPPSHLYGHYRLDAAGLADRARKILGVQA